MGVRINQIPNSLAGTAVASNDLVALWDTSAGVTVQVSLADAIAYLSSLVEVEATSFRYDTVAAFLADATLTYSDVSAGGFIVAGDRYFRVADSGAADQHETGAGGVKVYEAGPTFTDRTRFVDWLDAGYSVVDGTVFYADGVFYEAESGNTSIADLPGWKVIDTGASITIEANGVSTATSVDTFNFVGEGVTVSDAGGGQVNVNIPGANPNMIINGDMTAVQRGTSSTGITTAGYYTADRWKHNLNTIGTWTSEVVSDADFTPFGTTKVLKLTNTTADASPAAGDYFILAQGIEGLITQQINKGSSAAEQLTASFVVKSNVTGTYICEIEDIANSRHVSKSFTVNAANTAELKTITFPADTTGALAVDGSFTVGFNIWLAAGSDFTSGTLASSAWASTVSANRAVGQTNLAAATSNYFSLSRVQLQTGDARTPYRDGPVGSKRYYQRVRATVGGYGASAGQVITGPVRMEEMRATPTASQITTGLRSNVRVSPAAAIVPISESDARWDAATAAAGTTYIIDEVWALSAEY